MKPATLAALALIPVLAGCGREPRSVAARDGWRVADYPAGGDRRVGLFAVQRDSLTPLRAYASANNGSWVPAYPTLTIEPRDGGALGSVRIRAGNHVDAPIGPPFMLDVSFDGAPPEPVAFRRDSVDLLAPRTFADRLQRHHTVAITLPGWDRYHPPGVVTYRLDGLGPQLAALDAEFHARREGIAPGFKLLRSVL